MTHAEVIEGTVEGVNDRGIRVNGTWFNVSKFHTVDLPKRVGTRVRLDIDTKGFILDSTLLDDDADQTPTVLSARDDRITRVAVLEAAANFLGLISQSREEVRSDHVLILADKWLAWVNSPKEEL